MTEKLLTGMLFLKQTLILLEHGGIVVVVECNAACRDVGEFETQG